MCRKQPDHRPQPTRLKGDIGHNPDIAAQTPHGGERIPREWASGKAQQGDLVVIGGQLPEDIQDANANTIVRRIWIPC